jgi:hypothetical protein
MLKRVGISKSNNLTLMLAAIALATICAISLPFVTARVRNGEPPADALVHQYDGAGCGGVKFDGDGVAMATYPTIGAQYNPTTIAQVAIGCFVNYKRYKNSDYRSIYLNQIKWLINHAVEVSPDLAAYDYPFAWNYGLAPGWHSGLAQGQAISALIRYYYDTGDKGVLPLIRRLKNFMLLPVEQGGVSTISPEGGLWIEEFPSTPHSFVLNGFISAVFGLYEYTRLFHDEEEAQRQLVAAVESIKRSLRYYDNGHWMFLDRHSTPYPQANDDYAFGYGIQARTLWEVTGDPVFLAASLRWKSFLGDVNFHRDGNISQDGVSSFRLTETSAASSGPNILANNYEIVFATPFIAGYGPDQLFDGDWTTYYAAENNGPGELWFRLRNPATANALIITLYNVELYPDDLRLFVTTKDEPNTIHEISYRFVASRRSLIYLFPKRDVKEIRLVAMHYHGQERLVIGDVALSEVQLQNVPTGYGSYTTGPVQVSFERFSVGLDAPVESRGQIFVLYRAAATLAALEDAPWAWDFLDPFGNDERNAKSKFLQFKVLTTQAAGERGWKNFRVIDRGPAAPTMGELAFEGKVIELLIDKWACDSMDLGTIACGSPYRATFDRKLHRWTVTGYSRGERKDITAESDNADPKPGEISIWGLLATFDDDGVLYYSGRRVGMVRLGTTTGL